MRGSSRSAQYLDKRLTNKLVLHGVCLVYSLFSLAEVVTAFQHQFYLQISTLLLRDVTYKLILIVCLQLNAYGELRRERASLQDSKVRYSEQLHIPVVVLILLVAVSALTLWYSIKQIIQIPNAWHSSYQPYTKVVFGFSAGNIVVSSISFLILYFRGRDMYFDTPHDEIARIDRAFNMDDIEFDAGNKLNDDLDFSLVSMNEEDDDILRLRVRDFFCPSLVSAPSHQLGSPLNKNLNMLSGLSHVSLDAIKSTCGMAASILALGLKVDIGPCFAYASVAAFGIVMIFVVIPLSREIILSSREEQNNHGLYSHVTADDDEVVY